MSQANVDIFLSVLKAFQEGDQETWVQNFAEDAEFIPQRAPIQGTYRGHADIRAFLADNEETFSIFHPSYDDVRDCGDEVLALGKIRIKAKGGGVEIETPSALVVRYRDGKVVRLQDHGDREQAMRAAGLDAV